MYFKREEFACKCGCGFATVDVELLAVLEDLRVYFGKPVTITSACRCINHNHAVGGKPNSKHREGIAADVVVQDIDASIIYNYLDEQYVASKGIGKYTTFTHIDVRSVKARW
jgi:uncharacterized protein YcbK (DUF882 family)